MRLKILLMFLLPLIVLFPVSRLSAETLTENQPVATGTLTVQAGDLEYTGSESVLRYSGGVRIGFSWFEIETDSLEVDTEKRTAKTVADFVITTNEKDLAFSGKSFFYDFGEDRGTLLQVRTNVEGVNFLAEQVDIEPGGNITMKDVVASTCCLENMEYHVEAKVVELKAGGRAKFRKLALYFRNRRIVAWPSYSTGFRTGGAAAPGMDVAGGWVFSPPALGYSDLGGVEVKSDVKRTSRRLGGTSGLYVNYYARDGFFTEARQSGAIGDLFTYNARVGKQYKENTGYFRYFGPVVVWNYPALEITKNFGKFPGTKVEYGGSFEIGAMKEEETPKALKRAFFKGYAKLPLNSKRMPVRFSLIGDGRYGVYEKYREYRIWGNGVEMETGHMDRNYLRLQFLDFRAGGKTPFLSDLVNTNDKVFAFGSTRINKRDSFMVDAQYDKADSQFDEIVYSGVRNLECLEFFVSWRAERKSLGLSMRVLNPGGRGK